MGEDQQTLLVHSNERDAEEFVAVDCTFQDGRKGVGHGASFGN